MNALLSEVKGIMEAMESAQSSKTSEQEVTRWLSGASAKGAGAKGAAKKTRVIDRIEKLPGDASTRQYFRVESKDRSFIVMKMEPFPKGTPFLDVQKHLVAAGVDVPEILDTDPARGLMLLEDLGDVTLLRQLQEVSSPEVERHLYARVIDELVKLQVRASPRSIPKSGFEPYKLRFDHEKLMWEVNFCIEHFYQGYLGRNLKKADLKVIQDGFSEICGFVADQPTVLTHRDFHSRNIMVAPIDKPRKGGVQNRLVMIDFQDARLGPAQYDLASLLKDSYYQLDERQVDRLLDYYILRWEAVAEERLDRDHFLHVFDMMSVQRNFKAIGSFAMIQSRRGNPGYLKYIGNTFENIRRTLLRYPRYAKLRETLFHYYYF